MQITILRHGTPDLSEWDKIHSSRMSEWIEAYNAAGVKNETKLSCMEMVRELRHKCIVCSNLNRSIHSAKIIGYQSPHLIDAIFCEAELPYIQIPIIRLTPHLWSMIFRLFWLVGISPKAESKEVFESRVSKAAEKLIQLARDQDSVLFIGHGIFNRFLAKELIAKGWLGEEAPNGNEYWGYKYWEYATYTKA
ncbi:MAG: histidine phosphatase family protein [Methylophilaceae bacterium]